MCFSGVRRGSADNKDRHCWLMMRCRLVSLNTDLEVKVKAPSTASSPPQPVSTVQSSIEGKQNPGFYKFVGGICVVRAELARYTTATFSFFGINSFNSCTKRNTMMPLLMGNKLRMSLL